MKPLITSLAAVVYWSLRVRYLRVRLWWASRE